VSVALCDDADGRSRLVSRPLHSPTVRCKRCSLRQPCCSVANMHCLVQTSYGTCFLLSRPSVSSRVSAIFFWPISLPAVCNLGVGKLGSRSEAVTTYVLPGHRQAITVVSKTFLIGEINIYWSKNHTMHLCIYCVIVEKYVPTMLGIFANIKLRL
jgi:hypothetical protein